VVFPLPVGPTISVNRPRGSPPPSSTASSTATPVGSAGVGGGGGGRSLTSSASDKDMREERGRYRAGTEQIPKLESVAQGIFRVPPSLPRGVVFTERKPKVQPERNSSPIFSVEGQLKGK
jgi:hypothetical protein